MLAGLLVGASSLFDGRVLTSSDGDHRKGVFLLGLEVRPVLLLEALQRYLLTNSFDALGESNTARNHGLNHLRVTRMLLRLFYLLNFCRIHLIGSRSGLTRSRIRMRSAVGE